MGTSSPLSFNICVNHLTWLSQYPSFLKENDRYEDHLAATCPPGMFPFPWGKYENSPLRNVPQDNVWWALHPKHQKYTWVSQVNKPSKPSSCSCRLIFKYERLKEANKRYLDEVYSQRSPGSEPIWFGQRYRGYALSDVYKRPKFIDFCLDPAKQNCKFVSFLQSMSIFRDILMTVHSTGG